MTEEFSITTSLDQSLPVDIQEELDRVDIVIKQSVATKDIEIAYGLCEDYIVGMKRRGLALAKALAKIEDNWDAYNIGDNFLDTTYMYLGIHRHTVERYCKIWRLFSYVPDKYLEDVQQMGIKSIIPIANAVSQGYELDEDDWEEVLSDSSFANVNKYIREEVKGKEPRKSGLSLSLDREGSLWAYAEDKHFFIGSLEVVDDEPIVKKAIQRIVNNSGILER